MNVEYQPGEGNPYADNIKLIVAQVATHPGGVTAAELIAELINAGLPRARAEHAVQRALDRGEIELGRKMQLLVRSEAAA